MLNRILGVFCLFVLLTSIVTTPSCRRANASNVFTVTLTSEFSSVDPNIRPSIDAAGERLRQLIFNSLVKKDQNLNYAPDLAKEIKRSDDGLTYTFTLHENVKFHNGHPLTSADVKYTFETLIPSKSPKGASFFYEEIDPTTKKKTKKPYISSIETPDAKTVVIKLNKVWLPLLSNLVAVAIIPTGTVDTQKEHPIGSGPFKYVSKSGQTLVELERFADYWEGAPKIERLVVKVVKDANALQAELRSGNVTLAPLHTNVTAGAFTVMGRDPNLQVSQFEGANILYMGFNTRKAPLDNVKVRQAIAFAVNREEIVKYLLRDQAKVAHSLLPEGLWAYSAKTKYGYDMAKAKQLLDEAGFPDPDGDGPQMRFQDEISLIISSGNIVTSQVAQVIQQNLNDVGFPVVIESLENNIVLTQFSKGQFQMVISSWIGGNQDPIFLKDLFASSEIPETKEGGRNRHRYNNPEFDALINRAIDIAEHEESTPLYSQAQEILARDLPLLPLWYPANMVVAQKNVGNIKVDGSGDWRFIKDVTFDKK